jgi:hypothetical protein
MQTLAITSPTIGGRSVGIVRSRTKSTEFNFRYVYHGTWAHLNGVLHKSLPSVCVSVCVAFPSLLGKVSVNCIPPFISRQRIGKHVPVATNTRSNRIIAGRVIFYAVRILSMKSLWVYVCIPLSLLGNNQVETFPRQQELLEASFSMRSVSYQRKVDDKFFLELLVFNIIHHKRYSRRILILDEVVSYSIAQST